MTAAPSPAKEQAIAQVLQIMAANGLDAGDIRTALKHAKRQDSGDESGRRAPLGQMVLRVFYYLGGTLMFAGLGIYMNTVWDDLGSFQRVLVTLGTGFIAYLIGIFFARDQHLEKAATPAHMLAFILQPLGIFVLLKEYGHGGSEALGAMIAFGPLAVQQALTFATLKRPSLLLFALLYFYGFVGAATVYFDIDRGVSALACGLFLFFTTVDMQRRKAYRDLTPLFFVLGSALMLAGLYYHVGRTMFDPLALSLCLAFLMHAVLTESKMLFFVSILYVAMYFCGGPGGGWGSWSWSDANWRFNHEMAAIFSGSSLVLAGYWLNRSPFISAPPVWLFVGTQFVLGGFYSMLHETAGEPLFAGIATLAIYAALMMRSRAMLAASILSLLGFICAYAQQHFAKNADWPLLLILFGFIILLSGFVFARLSAKIKENPVQKT
jgi:hypothetical protein